MTIFERIISGEIPATIVHETTNVIAILDAFPQTEGHTLIIPKKPYKTIYECPKDILIEIIEVTQMLANEYITKYNATNCNILNNSGLLAGQTVDHLHFHLIPRYENDNCKFFITPTK